jgi:NAD(P)-dependent dehydrogenase (short-subunit alcohol dehydrogenase family)
VRVVTIAPGLMETPMLAGLSQEVRDSLAAQVPFPRRFGRASEYAELVGHIISNTMINA